MALRPATVFAVLVALLALLSMYVAWKAMFPRRTERLAVGTACAYTRRVQENGKWVCPKGTVDTGRSWEDKDGDGDKQCLVGCAVSPHCQYTQRTQQGKNKEWKCPEGYVDSGLDWGVPYGDRQCHKCPSVVDLPGKKCAFTGRYYTEGKQWRCPEGSLDTGSKEDWNACLLACCPTSGFKGRAGGTSELFPCGKWDIERKGGIRRVSDKGVPTELYPFCCQWTNKDCNAKLFRGLFQRIKDTGTKGTGYRADDNGCRVNVWDQNGNGVATTGKGMGMWGAIGLFAGVGIAAPLLAVAGAPLTAVAVASAPLALGTKIL